MSHIDSSRRRVGTTLGVVLVLLLASLGLAACGGSSSSGSSANASASATSSTGPAGLDRRLGAQGASRFRALRECLQKNGITLPQRLPGQRGGRPGGPSGPRGLLGGGGPQLPSGVTRAQMQATIKKCGGGSGLFLRSGTRLKSPAYRASLTRFAACMHENGVNVPAPNTSGNGPIFDTKGIDTNSAQFQTAERKCRSDLTATFRGTPGAGGPGGPPGG